MKYLLEKEPRPGRRLGIALAVLAIVLLLTGLSRSVVAQTVSGQRSSGKIGDGQPWQTEWFSFDSQKKGPVVMIFGGVHGNEPAGFRAAMQIKNWTVDKGKLIVVPQANKLGLRANTRWIPEFRNDKALKNLNRNFPTKADPSTKTELATALWTFIQDHQPDWFFDLHEGFDFHRINPKSVGSSVIAFPEQKDLASKLASGADQHISADRAFSVLAKSGPINGSVARACGEQLGAKSFILETTFKDQPISKRTRQHRAMVATALQIIGVTQTDQSQQFVSPSQTSPQPIRVAVFDADGANAKNVVKVLDSEPLISGFHIGPEDISKAVLKQFDVVLFPGGSGSKQGKAIGAERRELIRQFSTEGGGVVGICAGAFLCSSHYDWSLHLMNASVYNEMVDIPEKGRKSMWYRGGPVDVEVEISKRAESMLGLGGQHTIRYQNGPIISPGKSDTAPDYEVLATFRSENFLYDVQKGTMTGKPAILQSTFGKGKVVALSPHFESTKGKEYVVLNAIRQVVSGQPKNDQPTVFPDLPLGSPDEPVTCDVFGRSDPNHPREFEIIVQMQIANGWHTYANAVPDSPYRETVLKWQLPDQVEAIGKWNKPLALPYIKNPQRMIYSGTVVFSHKVRLKAGSDKAKLTVQIDYQVCDEQKCLPPAIIKKSVWIGDKP